MSNSHTRNNPSRAYDEIALETIISLELLFRLIFYRLKKRCYEKTLGFETDGVQRPTAFSKYLQKKRMAHANHDLHLLFRTIHEWLPQDIQSIIDGTYTPRFLKRYYFKDEMLDQLHISDRVLQHLLLHQLKSTFPHIMNPHCYHLHGPSGVRLATQRIREVHATQKPKYIIRADIKSYYKSIQHHVLLRDIKHYYTDPKIQYMLENIIRNPIETPRGYKNADKSIALRGPLSQFFSALYLKPLDDAFDTTDAVYLRYQDDLIILCQTKRQLERCKRRLMSTKDIHACRDHSIAEIAMELLTKYSETGDFVRLRAGLDYFVIV